MEWTQKLCEAMAGNTALVSLDLSDCALDDKCCDLLGAVLEADQKLASLNLNKNAIRDGGCAKLASSLARNITLREIELQQQKGGRKWGEGCLVTWLDMYKTNFSLIRVNWTTNSKNTVTLTKMLARNMDVNNKVKNGDSSWHGSLPAELRDSPPAIMFYQLEDVKAKRGGVGRSNNPDREVGKGKVLRNGVADVVAAPGSVQARLAAMRGEASPGGAPAPAPKKLWEPEPAPAPAPSPAPAPAPARSPPARAPPATPEAVQRYTCVKKSQVRAGFEMDSDKAGVLKKGEVIDAYELKVNDQGTTRVRFARGWVSMAAGNGAVVLEPVGGAAAAAPAAPSTSDRVSALKEAGMEHFASRRFGESIAALEEAQSLDSTDEEVLEALEFARQAEKKYKQEQSLKLQERAMDAFTAREFDEAVELLERALEYTPGDGEITEALAYAKTQTAVE